MPPTENMIKEAAEEASISKEIAIHAKPAGIVYHGKRLLNRLL